MSAPAICAMNMDLGLLMVMCPVLKSCSNPLGASAQYCGRDSEYIWTLSCIKMYLYGMHYALDAAARGLAEGHKEEKALHLEQEEMYLNSVTQLPLACMSVPADDVAAMTKPATARPAITPPFVVPDQTANTKMATCNTQRGLMTCEFLQCNPDQMLPLPKPATQCFNSHLL